MRIITLMLMPIVSLAGLVPADHRTVKTFIDRLDKIAVIAQSCETQLSEYGAEGYNCILFDSKLRIVKNYKTQIYKIADVSLPDDAADKYGAIINYEYSINSQLEAIRQLKKGR